VLRKEGRGRATLKPTKRVGRRWDADKDSLEEERWTYGSFHEKKNRNRYQKKKTQRKTIQGTGLKKVPD